MSSMFRGSCAEMKARALQLLRLHDIYQGPYRFGREQSRQAVFFDIDDTLLVAKGITSRTGFLPAIRPIVELCRACAALGLFVVIITARPDVKGNRTFTEQELAHHHIPYHLLYMCPTYIRNVELFKRECRRDALGRLKCDPLFSIGDRDWDMGKYGGYGLLLTE